MAILEGVRFWARKDAVNDEMNLLDPNVSAPLIVIIIEDGSGHSSRW
jgi:hypothetical protein